MQGIVTAFLAANPEAQRAAHYGAEFAAEVHRVRLIVDLLGKSLLVEGVLAEARIRIARSLTESLLGTDEARARMRDHETLTRRLREGGF